MGGEVGGEDEPSPAWVGDPSLQLVSLLRSGIGQNRSIERESCSDGSVSHAGVDTASMSALDLRSRSAALGGSQHQASGSAGGT